MLDDSQIKSIIDHVFTDMTALLHAALQGRYAVPSFCVWNAETIRTVLDAAQSMRAPVIIMSGPGEFSLLTPRQIALTARALASEFSVPVVLHLDHGDSIERVEECIDAGFNSVMLDLSRAPFEDNVAGMKRVVALAKRHGIAVEGELGIVGSVDHVTPEGGVDDLMTDPKPAEAFVRDSGVDSLAVAFGNSHGIYRSAPRFDFRRLSCIAEAVGIPLVWHGGSGTSRSDLRSGIAAGIAKVNVASELVRGIRTSLTDQWQEERNLWVPDALAEAMQPVRAIVRSWIEKCGAGGVCDG